MNEDPDWVEIVTYFGLDPLTVWVEYRILLYAVAAAAILILLFGTYWFALQLRTLFANYKHSFAHNMAFYRSIEEMPENVHVEIENALGTAAFVYGFPAVALADVAGFRKSVGWLLLTKTQLIFTSNGSKCEFRLDSFRDANINDNAQSINLKLILEDSKPMFQMLGVNRDHAQELFMKMNAFRIALKEQTL